jgi:cell division protein FtsI (penicillin-binding protein 3)
MKARARSLLRPLLPALATLLLACGSARDPHAPAPLGPSERPAPGLFRSTIDPILQPFAEAELARTLEAWEASAGVILVLDPATGSILANAGREGSADADIALRRPLVTGSTLKTITLAAALDERAITLSDRFDCEMGARSYGDRVLRDAGKHGILSVPELLVVSTNIGFSKIFDRLGGEKLARALRRFHFGEAPPLPGAAAGDVPPVFPDRSFEGGALAGGESMKATPLQLALAYAVLANDGVYVPPTLTPRTGEIPREPVIKAETARTVMSILEQTVNAKDATGKHARIPGVRVAGKTGTAEWTSPKGLEGTYASFVGLVPAERPRFLILVGIEGPRGGETGGSVAAPVFARIARRALDG